MRVSLSHLGHMQRQQPQTRITTLRQPVGLDSVRFGNSDIAPSDVDTNAVTEDFGRREQLQVLSRREGYDFLWAPSLDAHLREVTAKTKNSLSAQSVLLALAKVVRKMAGPEAWNQFLEAQSVHHYLANGNTAVSISTKSSQKLAIFPKQLLENLPLNDSLKDRTGGGISQLVSTSSALLDELALGNLLWKEHQPSGVTSSGNAWGCQGRNCGEAAHMGYGLKPWGVYWLGLLHPDLFPLPSETAGIPVPEVTPAASENVFVLADFHSVALKLRSQMLKLEDTLKTQEEELKTVSGEHSQAKTILAGLQAELQVEFQSQGVASGTTAGDAQSAQVNVVQNIRNRLEAKKAGISKNHVEMRMESQRQLVASLQEQELVLKTVFERNRQSIRETLLELDVAINLVDVGDVRRKTFTLAGALQEKARLDTALVSAMASVSGAYETIQGALAASNPAALASAMDKVQEHLARNLLKKEAAEMAAKTTDTSVKSAPIKFSGRNSFTYVKDYEVAWENMLHTVFIEGDGEKFTGEDILVAIAKTVMDSALDRHPEVLKIQKQIEAANKKLSRLWSIKVRGAGKTFAWHTKWQLWRPGIEGIRVKRQALSEEIQRLKELREETKRSFSLDDCKVEYVSGFSIFDNLPFHFPANARTNADLKQLRHQFKLALDKISELEGCSRKEQEWNPQWGEHLYDAAMTEQGLKTLREKHPELFQSRQKQVPQPELKQEVSGGLPQELTRELTALLKTREAQETNLAQATETYEKTLEQYEAQKTNLTTRQDALRQNIQAWELSDEPEKSTYQPVLVEEQWQVRRQEIMLENLKRMLNARSEYLEVAAAVLEKTMDEIHGIETVLEKRQTQEKLTEIGRKTLALSEKLKGVQTAEEIANSQVASQTTASEVIRQAELTYYTTSAHISMEKERGEQVQQKAAAR